MKVRISAFQLTYHPKLNIDTLAGGLHARQNTHISWPPHRRVLRVARDGDYVLGALLTDRGHRAFVAIDTESNDVSRGELTEGKNFGAFSFFILSKKKPAAIITSYRDAGGASFIFGVLEMIGDETLQKLRDTELARPGSGLTTSQRKAVVAAHKPPSLRWVEYLGPTEYAAVLRRWQRIKAVEIAYNAAGAPAAYIPVDGDDVETTQLRLSFKRTISVARAVNCVTGLWQKKTKTEDSDEVIKVDGIDELGLWRRIELQDKIPTLLGELDHDEVIKDDTTFHNDLKKSYVIRHLKHLIQAHPAIFG